MNMVFQNTPKDLLEVFFTLWRLINKRTLYYDILACVTWPSKARWSAVFQRQILHLKCKHHTLLFL